jgi:hypothetical protein
MFFLSAGFPQNPESHWRQAEKTREYKVSSRKTLPLRQKNTAKPVLPLSRFFKGRGIKN